MKDIDKYQRYTIYPLWLFYMPAWTVGQMLLFKIYRNSLFTLVAIFIDASDT